MDTKAQPPDRSALKYAILIVVTMAVIVFILFFMWRSRDPEELSSEQRLGNLSGRKLTVLTNPPHLRAAEVLAQWFNEETGAAVRNVSVDYKDMLQETLKDTLSGKPALDVVMIWYADLGTLVEKGSVADLTDFIEQNRNIIRPDDFIPSLYAPYTLYKGRRWAVPYDGDTHVLFYRKSLLSKYHLSPPETWDDYLNIARTVTEKEKDKGIYGAAIMAPRISMIIVSSFMNRLGTFGGSLLDDKGRPTLDSPEAPAALSAMTEQSQYALPGPLETDWEVSRDAFLSGRVAMAEQWTDIGVMAEDASDSVIRGDWGAVQIPKGSGEKGRHAPALNAGFSLALSAKAPNPDVARAYLLFASRPDITLRLNLINGGIDPVRVSVLKSQEYRQFAPQVSKSVQAALGGASAWPNVPQTPKLLDELTGNLVMALEGRKSPRQAMDDTQAKWLNILK